MFVVVCSKSRGLALRPVINRAMFRLAHTWGPGSAGSNRFLFSDWSRAALREQSRSEDSDTHKYNYDVERSVWCLSELITVYARLGFTFLDANSTYFTLTNLLVCLLCHCNTGWGLWAEGGWQVFKMQPHTFAFPAALSQPGNKLHPVSP